MSGGLYLKIINIVAQGLTLVVGGVCLEGLLTARRGTKLTRIAAWTLSGLIWVAVKSFFVMPPVYYGGIHTTLILLAQTFVLIRFYGDRLWIKFTHGVLLDMQTVFAEMLLYLLLGDVKNMDFMAADFSNPALVERSVMVTAVTILFNMIYLFAVQRLRKNKRRKASPVWIAVMLQLVFLCILVCVAGRPGDIFDVGYGIYLSYAGGFIVLEVGVVMLYSNQLEKREAQEKIRRLQREGELKSAHYAQVEVRRRELEQLRENYQNILSSILELLERGENSEAETALQDLSVRIAATKEYPFCAVPVVNAVLAEKQKICEAEGISLRVDLAIPDTAGIAELDFCMIFSNLTNNAVRACREAKALGKASAITLTGGAVQGYLIIKCENTALANHKNKIWGTGYGHKILADIARKYDGDFRTSYENESFTAQISLRIRN
ncbi:MAG: GHKL domain-containing protein [Eubacteriales bacterium]|nr:GHKL domain-containing protein [Eubacteriales bacterium]